MPRVPAHAGGVDLSILSIASWTASLVPAHAGGVDLSKNPAAARFRALVPAHAGGVDLSDRWLLVDVLDKVPLVPAHAGGVDLSVEYDQIHHRPTPSPPMRAGWI